MIVTNLPCNCDYSRHEKCYIKEQYFEKHPNGPCPQCGACVGDTTFTKPGPDGYITREMTLPNGQKMIIKAFCPQKE